MLRKYHLKSQLRILTRYTGMLKGGVMSYLGVSMFLIVLLPKADGVNLKNFLNIPLLCVAFGVYFSTPLFGDLFCGKENERRSYRLSPWSLRYVIISKNLISIITAILFPIPLLIVSAWFYPAGLQDYLNALLFLIMSFPICMLFGNWLSVSSKALQSTSGSQDTILLLFLIITLMPVPYVIFKLWLHSLILCISFFAISLNIWYYYELQFIENKFLTYIFKIS
jgi:hypothetical protein